MAAEIKGKGQKAFAYTIDLCKREEVYKLAATVTKEVRISPCYLPERRADSPQVGNVSILINNAGIVTGKTLMECPDELMRKTFDVNVVSHFWTLKAFLPHMMANNHGHIVTVASMAGHVGVAGLVDYCASKFAAVGLDESLRAEFKKLKLDGEWRRVVLTIIDLFQACLPHAYARTTSTPVSLHGHPLQSPNSVAGMFDGVQIK